MTAHRGDAFEALRLPPLATDPDPVFARHLRRQVERALERAHEPARGQELEPNLERDLEPRLSVPTTGGTVTVDTDPTERTPAGVVPYLAVSDGHAALAWYAQALDATEFGERYEDGGRIGHAAMRVHGAVFYLADPAPELGLEAPPTDAPVSTSLVLAVPDADAAADRAVAAGASLERAPADNPYGRIAVVRDPFGHRWMLEGPVLSFTPAQSEPPEQARAGDLAYATLCVGDADLADVFYGSVLGWEVAPGSVPEGRQVTNTTVPTGIWGGRGEQTVRCCWQVDDVDEALERVRAAGGSAEPPADQPYGRLAACVDDQGVGFDLYSPAAGAEPGPRLPLNGTRQGDLSYLTLELPDRARALAFYRSVLGWRTPDDSDPVDVHPMLGLADTGPGRAVPMWKVDDVTAAVQRVRAAGGTATDPEQQPYGLTAICSDDQGMPFYLGDT